ncbi:hypothetical protein D9M69_528520 [compost metagenome]
MSAARRRVLAVAASMADCASTTWERDAAAPARAESTWERAASKAASALSSRARSSSSCCWGMAWRATRVSVRTKRFCVAVSSAWRWLTMAAAVACSLSRWATRASAVALAFSARRTSARAWASWASSTWVSMRASTCPSLTKSPSSTAISATRPGSLVATSSSVASMRPLPLAKPSPSPAGRKPYQAPAAPAATIRTSAQARLRPLGSFIRSPANSIATR